MQPGGWTAAPSPVGALLAALACLGTARCYDMYPCTDKPSYTNMSCPADTAVACWSLDPNVQWLCWTRALVPQWLFGPLPGMPGDVKCKAYPTPPGAARPFYDGACTFQTPSKVAPPPLLPPPRTWDEAYQKAGEVRVQMKESEKHEMLNGIGWYWPPWNGWWELKKYWYVGNTAAVPRLGIPSLNMQDSAGGFRPYWEDLVGTVTCWPSQLALAAAWDPDLVRVYAMALGAEFRRKGANTVLGPSANVHRVGRGGRNFEYLSGEDPYLGTRLVKPWVEGVQSQGILAVVKHWVFNEQETNRDTEDSQVDRKTAWELYYPPFKAAVKAGVSAAMCSYNKENGRHSCSNAEELRTLKHDLGFRGFVQSDWWALHHMGLPAGTDQDMPGISDPGIGNTGECSPPACRNTSSWFMPSLLATQPQTKVDAAVERILAAIYHLDIKSSCSPPNCEEWYKQNVTEPEHAALARYIAVESVVLLKNAGGLLPLPGTGESKVSSIAIVGEAAVAKPYDPAGLGQGQGVWNKGDLYSGGGSGHIAMAPNGSQYVKPLDGISRRAKLAGLKVIAAPTDDVTEATAAAQQADVTIVVCGTTGQEAADRPNLNLDGDADSLIANVSKVSKNVVVLMQIPGQVLTPWRDSVGAIMALFLGGQATGDAWADVLFGDTPPSGKLPVMMPASEADTVAPSKSLDVPYLEGLKTSYRNKGFKAAFPFGHGLSYSKIIYKQAHPVECKDGAHGDICFSMSLQNAGTVPSKAVPQLYLEFPPEAEHPAPFLKGFQKTPVIMPGATQDVTFHLTDEELRYYDAHMDQWVRPASVVAHVGDSSADIKLTVQLGVSKQPSGRTLWIVLFLVTLLAVVLAIILVVRHARRRKALSSEDGCACGEESEDSDSSSNEDSEAP